MEVIRVLMNECCSFIYQQVRRGGGGNIVDYFIIFLTGYE